MQFFSSLSKKEKLSSSTEEANQSNGSLRNSLEDNRNTVTTQRDSLTQSCSDYDNPTVMDTPIMKLEKEDPETSEASSMHDKLSLSNLTTSQLDKVKITLVEEFRCPISHMIMKDPVFTSDGETYEREEIERWLRVNQTSPATNVKLADKVLKPNIALRKTISTFLEQNPDYFEELYFSRSSEKAFIEACKTLGVDSDKEAEMIKEIKNLVHQDKRFLIHRFDSDGTILHIAAQYSSITTFRAVYKFWKTNLKLKSTTVKEGLLDKDQDGYTPVHLAAYINTDYDVAKDIIRRLRKEGIESVEPLSKVKRAIKEAANVLDGHFLQAVRDEDFDNMIFFYKLGASIEARDAVSKYKGSTALHIASSKGNAKIVEFLLNEGALMTSRTGTHPADFASIHFASRSGHIDIINLLCDRNMDINFKCNPNGCRDWTPLHLAVRNGRINAVELLVKRGADVNAPGYEEDRMGPGWFGPAYLAVYYGHMDCAKLLLDAGAHLEGSNDELHLLHAAVKNHQVDMVKMLLARGANINVQDHSTKKTALHLACSSGDVNITKTLVNYQLQDRSEEYSSMELSDLIRKVIDVNAEDKKGNTPLHEAAIQGHKDVVCFLIASGANWKAKNASGKTASEEAIRANKKDVAEEITREIQTLKSIRIQQFKPMKMQLMNQEAIIKKQSEIIEKQNDEIKKQAAEIEQMKTLIAALQKAVFGNDPSVQ